MESPKATIVYVTYLTVGAVEEATTTVHIAGWGKDAIFKTQTVGWDVFWEEQIGGLRFPEKPEFKPGDRIKITYERMA